MSSNYSTLKWPLFVCACKHKLWQEAAFLNTFVSFFMQFFFFLLIIFAIEVAAGIWGFSNQTKVTKRSAWLILKHGTWRRNNMQNRLHNSGLRGSVTSVLCFCLQLVNDITTFYKQTYNTYQTSKEPRLKETLRVIQTGVSRHLTGENWKLSI